MRATPMLWHARPHAAVARSPCRRSTRIAPSFAGSRGVATRRCWDGSRTRAPARRARSDPARWDAARSDWLACGGSSPVTKTPARRLKPRDSRRRASPIRRSLRRHSRDSPRRLDEVAAREVALGLVVLLVHDEPRLTRALVEIHGPGHHGIDDARHVAHVISPDVAGRVAQAVRKQAGRRVEQEARGLDDVAGNGDGPRLLLVRLPRRSST